MARVRDFELRRRKKTRGGAIDSIIANPGIPNGNAMDMGRQMPQEFVVWNHQGAQVYPLQSLRPTRPRL